MLAYIIRRLLLMIPTLFGIMVVNFAIVQIAPGGPIDQIISQIRGNAGGALERVSGSSSGDTGSAASSGVSSESTRGSRGIDPQLIKDLERQLGFDKPPLER